MRILWHIFTDPVGQAPYVERLQRYLGDLAGPDVKLDLVGLDPPDTHLHRLSELRTGAQVVANLIEAEPRGYDAVAIGHYQDPGLWEARAALDVPVLGLGEASMLFACMFGRRIGLVTISPVFIPWHEEQVHRYHLDDRVVGVSAIETSVQRFIEACEDPSAYAELKRTFVEQAAALARGGAEVIIPAGGLPAVLFRDEQRFETAGAVILNPVPVLVRQAEAAASLHRRAGFGTSRHSTFAAPSAAAREQYVEQLGGHLQPIV